MIKTKTRTLKLLYRSIGENTNVVYFRQRNNVRADIPFHSREIRRLESQLDYRQEENPSVVETDASRFESLSGLSVFIYRTIRMVMAMVTTFSVG